MPDPEVPEWVKQEPWYDAQQHRYDKGHYLDGRVHPMYRNLRSRFPSPRYGMRLVIASLLLAFAITASTDIPALLAIGYSLAGLLAAIGVVLLVAGPRRG